MIYQYKCSRYINLKLYNSRTSCRNQGSLDIFIDGRTAFNIYSVKYFANYMKRGNQVRTTITNKQTYYFTHVGGNGIISC